MAAGPVELVIQEPIFIKFRGSKVSWRLLSITHPNTEYRRIVAQRITPSGPRRTFKRFDKIHSWAAPVDVNGPYTWIRGTIDLENHLGM